MARRDWWALMPILFSLSGCLWTEHTESSAWMDRLAKQTISPDSAIIRVALVERPIGDDFINGKLWQHVDEMAVDEDCRDRLEANGFRVGQLVGPPTTELQQLLVSKNCSGKDFAFGAGKTIQLPLGPVLPRTSYCMMNGKTPEEIVLQDARYCLDVSGRLVKEGTRLTFTPRVEHGAPRLPFQAAPDHRSWEIRTEKSCRKYPELSWDVVLGQNQYLLVSAHPSREKSLGQGAFMQANGVQRLLVIINCRAGTPSDNDERMEGDPMPLALQATMPTPNK